MRGLATIALGLLLAAPAAASVAAGRPCPSLSPDAFARTLMATRVLPGRHFGFGGAFFARASGGVSCVMRHEGGGAAFPTCRFSNPKVLQISTAKGRFDFLPAPGPATVTVRDGEAACTMGAG
jgi:hypothetical protein